MLKIVLTNKVKDLPDKRISIDIYNMAGELFIYDILREYENKLLAKDISVRYKSLSIKFIEYPNLREYRIDFTKHESYADIRAICYKYLCKMFEDYYNGSLFSDKGIIKVNI